MQNKEIREVRERLKEKIKILRAEGALSQGWKLEADIDDILSDPSILIKAEDQTAPTISEENMDWIRAYQIDTRYWDRAVEKMLEAGFVKTVKR